MEIDKVTRRKLEYEHKDAPNTELTIIEDEFGRIASRITRDGKVVASNMYGRIPKEYELREQGWIRK